MGTQGGVGIFLRWGLQDTHKKTLHTPEYAVATPLTDDSEAENSSEAVFREIMKHKSSRRDDLPPGALGAGMKNTSQII